MGQTADSFEVSPQQEQLWTVDPDGPQARVQARVTLEGALDVAGLQAALEATVARHEILRTRFAHQPGLRIPTQVVEETLTPTLATLDLAGADAQAQRRAAALAGELTQPFDLQAGGLMRALLISRGPDAHELVLTVSALAADAASMAVLLAEIAGHYGGDGAPVPDPLQYADFSAWQRELLASDEDEARSAAAFWERASRESPQLPFARSAAGPVAAEELEVALDAALAGAVRSAAQNAGVPASAVVQAAWHALLGRYAGAEAVTVTYLAGERRHEDLDGAIGAFSRPVPLHTTVEASTTFAELLRAVAIGREDALAWQDYAPIDGAPGSSVGFIAAPAFTAQPEGLALALSGLQSTGALRLWLTCVEGDSELRIALGFDTATHARDSMERLTGALSTLLAAAAAAPDAELGDLELLHAAERTQVLDAFNDTASPVPAASVAELIRAAGAEAPDRVAVRDAHGAITYAQLQARANQLAQRLGRAGVGPGVPVALCTDRSIDMVVGTLGILGAGGAYVPLHPEHPKARLAAQVQTAGVRALVTQEALLPGLPEVSGEVICLDRDRTAIESESTEAPAVSVAGDDLAYIIFTSGSTGTPKGVGVTNANVVNYATDLIARVGADREPLRFGMVTAISTDLGNTSLFGALCSGGTLVLVAQDTAGDAGAMARYLAQAPVDVIKITPSHAGALIAGGEAGVLPRRRLVLGGERAPWDLVQRVRAISGCAILNHYGPTETTIGSCTFPVPDGPGAYAPSSVPIGRPIANTRCYVLDDRHRPVPIGVTGRLHIAGAGVARGYAGEPELTAERFLEDPFAGDGRMYDTGDLVRWLPDGALEFLGRADEQVKIRGYRVEPGEVESALRSDPHVREAVAIVAGADTGDPRLVAYCATDGQVTQQELRTHLADWLPEFMMPAAIAILDALPRTPSGKIDRLALPDVEAEVDEGEYVAPRSPMEEAVATIWAQVLGVGRVSVEEDFFALGGHSLLATQVVAQVRSDFAVDLPLHSLFTHPTIESLTAEIVRMMGEADDDETARLMAELEGMSDEEAERLLGEELPRPDAGQPR